MCSACVVYMCVCCMCCTSMTWNREGGGRREQASNEECELNESFFDQRAKVREGTAFSLCV